MVSGGVAGAAEALADGLAQARELLAERDIAPGERSAGGAVDSAAPWNAAVAAAILDAHAGLRRLERQLREEVTGHPGEVRGGSDANTAAALSAIVNLAEGIGQQDADMVTRTLMRWAAAAQRLAAVDTLARWLPIRPQPGARPPRCPYCRTYSLRVAARSMVVMCFYPGKDGNGCTDRDGRQPYAKLDFNKLNGDPVLLWADGVVQADPEPAPLPAGGTDAGHAGSGAVAR